MIKNNWEDNMLNKFKYKNWTFVEYINPKKSYPRPIADTGGTYTKGHSAIYRTRANETQMYDRIINWFKHVEEELPDVGEVWEALTDQEAAEWFKNSKSDFKRWWNSLSTKLKHYYTDRLENGKSLLPDDLPGVPDIPPEKSSLRLAVINDKLALSSVDINVLDSAKEMIEAIRGVVAYEYRTTKNDKGECVHTYIFDLK